MAVRNENGFTLIELVIAMAIGVVILAIVGYSVAGLFNLNTRATNHMTAVQEVQNAGYWFTRDAVQAPSGLTGSPPPGYIAPPAPWISVANSGHTLNLYWRDSDNISILHGSTLSWDGSSLWRKYDTETTDASTNAIARDISSISFSVTSDNSTGIPYVSGVTMVVTATVSSRGLTSKETRTYEVSPRAGEAP